MGARLGAVVVGKDDVVVAAASDAGARRAQHGERAALRPRQIAESESAEAVAHTLLLACGVLDLGRPGDGDHGKALLHVGDGARAGLLFISAK